MTKRILLAIVVGLAVLSSGPAMAVPEWVTCDPESVVTYGNRVHVRCTASIAGIFFFARSTNDGVEAARFMSTLLTAQVAGRTLSILTDFADTSGTAFGCEATDCRLLLAAGFGN